MDQIITAKERQTAEANQAANNLLKEIDAERSREETKKVAAAKKREKRKAKKKEKQIEETTEQLNAIEEEEKEKESEPIAKVTRINETTPVTPIAITPPVVSSKPENSPMDDGWQEVVSKPKKTVYSHVEPKRSTGDKTNTSLSVKSRSKTVTSTRENESKYLKTIPKEISTTKPSIYVTSPPPKETHSSEYNPFASNILTTSLVGALTKPTEESKRNFAHVAKMNVPMSPVPSSTCPSTSSSSTSSSPSSFQQIIDLPKPLAPIGSHRPSSVSYLSRSPSNLNPSAPEFHHIHSPSSSFPQEPLSANIMNIARMMEQSSSAQLPTIPTYFSSSPFDNTPTTLEIAHLLASRGQLPTDQNEAAAIVAAYYYNNVVCRSTSASSMPLDSIVHCPKNSFSLVDHSNSNFSTGPSPPAAIGSERKRHIHMNNTFDSPRKSFD